MSAKTNNVMNHIESKGRAIIKLDRASGLIQFTITKRSDNRYVVGTHPGSIVRSLNKSEVEKLLNDNLIFINSWS